MAAPTPTVRGTPVGRKIPDGFSTKLTFARFPTLGIFEKTVKGYEFDGGEPIPQSTMHNVRYHTFAPRTLIKSGPVVLKCAYDEDVIANIMNLLNSPDTITEGFPTGSTLCYYGWLMKFTQDPREEGKQPEAEVTIFVSNYDYVNNVEAAPVFTPAATT